MLQAALHNRFNDGKQNLVMSCEETDMAQRRRSLIILSVLFFVSVAAGQVHAAKKSDASAETLEQYIEELKINPGDAVLRKKIIKHALSMKPVPSVPETAERNMARGIAFFNKAGDNAGYRKAIVEFEAASNAAPWLGTAYYNLGIAQEKASLYTEAIQNLKLYLVASPDAKNVREVKNKIYSLEVDIEERQAAKAPPPVIADPVKTQLMSGKTELAIESEKQLKIVKMPPAEKKSTLPNFIGAWYFKDTVRDEEVTVQAFEIAKNPNGDLIVIPPKRSADYVSTIPIFEIAERTLKLQIKWKMASPKEYWYFKTETYELNLAEDGAKLSGTYNQRSYGGRNVDIDRTLFRQ